MKLVLYELAAGDPNVRFSPHCWKVRMALAHKGLEAELRPWHFTEKEEISFSGQGGVPVLVHGKEVISDSWSIAAYLEDAFPDKPSLFDGPVSQALTRFVNDWADTVILPNLAQLVLTDIHASLASCDQTYFRETREKRFGKPLEKVSADRNDAVHEFRKLLTPLRLSLKHRPFLSGKLPLYADYSVFGFFMWARCISDFELLDTDDPLDGWRNRLLDAFDGMARNAARSIPT